MQPAALEAMVAIANSASVPTSIGTWRVVSATKAAPAVVTHTVPGTQAHRGPSRTVVGALRSLLGTTEQLPCGAKYPTPRLDRFFGEGKCLRPHRGAGPMG